MHSLCNIVPFCGCKYRYFFLTAKQKVRFCYLDITIQHSIISNLQIDKTKRPITRSNGIDHQKGYFIY
nr:MAG TPA: hypothetical protein [Caudoviricetes sp.]